MWDIDKNNKVFLDSGEIIIKPNDHVATGGEGLIYRPGNKKLTVKIWLDDYHVQKTNMIGRIKELTIFQDDGKFTNKINRNIVAPQSFVRDQSGKMIGYTMDWVEGWALPRAFNNDWRRDNGFGDPEALSFIQKMKAIMQAIHQKNIIIGDANELNIIGVGSSTPSPCYIDVDSWIPDGFTGDKILPTIRDWHTQPFTKEADWFAYAVVTFQLLTGIHPYKGTHPDFKRNDLEGRMKKNISVFNHDVRLSPAVRPFNTIPGNLLNWYKDVFEQNIRDIPPDPILNKMMPIMANKMTIGDIDNMIITKLYDLEKKYIRQITQDLILLQDGSIISLVDGRQFGKTTSNRMVFFYLSDGKLGATQVNPQTGNISFGLGYKGQLNPISLQETQINAQSTWVIQNRLFAICHDGIMELLPRNLGHNTTLLTGLKWALNAKSTIFGQGGAVYSALGAQYLIVPQKEKSVAIIRVKEIDDLKIMNIISNGKIVILNGILKTGLYQKAIIRIQENLSSYSIQLEDTQSADIPDIVMETGLILSPEDDKLIIKNETSQMPIKLSQEILSGKFINSHHGIFCLVGKTMFKLEKRK